MGLRDYYYGMTLGGFVYDRPDPEWVNPVKKKCEEIVEKALARDKMARAVYDYDRAYRKPLYNEPVIDYQRIATEAKRTGQHPEKILHDLYHKKNPSFSSCILCRDGY